MRFPVSKRRSRRTWQDYWSKQTAPFHREDTEPFYRFHAGELKLLFPEMPTRVLELGCGNGALYELLDFDKTEYTGVDFSRTMLNEFAGRHPQAHLVLADVEDYRDSTSYDLLFSSQMVQYLDKMGFERALANAVTMLGDHGCIISASIPWRAMRLRYLAGEFSGRSPNLVEQAYGIAAGLANNTMGRWYSFAEIDRLGRRYGLRSDRFGSVCYPYRFSVRMTRRRDG